MNRSKLLKLDELIVVGGCKFVMRREGLCVDPWLAASTTVDGITMSKVTIPSGAVSTDALN
jgi:hypothetical protein